MSAQSGKEQIQAALLKFPNIIGEEIDLSAFVDEAEVRKIKHASAYADRLIAMMQDGGETGYASPWKGTEGKFEFRKSELTIWSGAKGHGKSLVISQVLENFISNTQKVFIISPEFPPHRVLHRMMIQSLGVHNATPEVALRWIDAVDDYLWLYDQQRSLAANDVPLICRYAVEKFGVDHILIDSLMKLGIANDDYAGQKRMVDHIQNIAHKSNVHIHLVAHAKKGSADEKIGSLHDVKGASEIADMAENVLFVWRNKAKELGGGGIEEPDCIVKVEAQRNGDGWIGTIPLWFNKESFTFREAI